ncbi:CrcB family protein [Jeotgalicoccus huakuii]|nr:CrcB family protein [Jeotgalicoccus huakuii]
MINLITMLVAAGLGACLRVYISNLAVFKDKEMPYGTLAVNIIGSFLMGLSAMILLANSQYYFVITTGFLGGFTTYSQFALDQFDLLREKKTVLFFKYSLASIFFTLAGIAFGLIVGSMFV